MRFDWTQTRSGAAVWPLRLTPDVFNVRDIAHHLAFQNRYAGATRYPVSVAQHCVLGSYAVADYRTVCALGPPCPDHYRHLLPLVFLVHDAHEFALVDLPAPVKADLEAYRAAELLALEATRAWLDLPAGCFGWGEVVEMDRAMLATEARDTMARPPMPWGNPVPPLPLHLTPWTWRRARHAWRTRFRQLVGPETTKFASLVGNHHHA